MPGKNTFFNLVTLTFDRDVIMVHLHTKFHESMSNRRSARAIKVSSIGVLKQRNKETNLVKTYKASLHWPNYKPKNKSTQPGSKCKVSFGSHFIMSTCNDNESASPAQFLEQISNKRGKHHS